VDNQASVAICRRFAESKGYAAEVTHSDDGYILDIHKQ